MMKCSDAMQVPCFRRPSHSSVLPFASIFGSQGLLLVAAANAKAHCEPRKKPDKNFCADKCGPYTLHDGCEGTFKVDCPCTGASPDKLVDAPTPTPTWGIYGPPTADSAGTEHGRGRGKGDSPDGPGGHNGASKQQFRFNSAAVIMFRMLRHL